MPAPRTFNFGDVVEFDGRRRGEVVRGVVTKRRLKRTRRVAPHYVCEVSPMASGGGRRGGDVVWTVRESILRSAPDGHDDTLGKTEALERTQDIKRNNNEIKAREMTEGREVIDRLGLAVGTRVRIRGRNGPSWGATIGKMNMRTGKIGLRRQTGGNDPEIDPVLDLALGRLIGRGRAREFRWVHPRCIIRVAEATNPTN